MDRGGTHQPNREPRGIRIAPHVHETTNDCEFPQATSCSLEKDFSGAHRDFSQDQEEKAEERSVTNRSALLAGKRAEERSAKPRTARDSRSDASAQPHNYHNGSGGPWFP